MSAVAIDNAALPPIGPNGAAPSAPSSDDGFRKALTSETDKTASEPVAAAHAADDAKSAATHQDAAPAKPASAQHGAKEQDVAATNGSSAEPVAAEPAVTETSIIAPSAAKPSNAAATPSGPDAAQPAAQPAVAPEDAAALLVILAQLANAQTTVQPQTAAAGKAPGVTTTKAAAAATATPPKDAKPKAADQSRAATGGKPKSQPDAAETLAAIVAPVVQPASPQAAAAAPPAQPAADSAKAAESSATPEATTGVSDATTAPNVQDLLAAAASNPNGSADAQPAQSASPRTADDFAAQVSTADPKRDDPPRAAAADANAPGPIPQTQQSDAPAPAPASQLRVETRPFAAEPAIQQLAVHVTRAVKDGLDRFDIDLKPDTLGRVTVRLEFGSESRVHAVFAAERPETLTMLRRDAHEITRAFNDAGVRADAGSLSFSLNGNGGQSDRQVFAGRPILFPAPETSTEPAIASPPPLAGYSRAGGVDIRI